MEEVKKYAESLKAKKDNPPIWEKKCLTIGEASEYSGLSQRHLKRLVNKKKCPFVMVFANQPYIVREKFNKFLEESISI